MEIREKRPDGRGSVKEVRKWISAIDKNMSDATPLWKSLTPGIKQALRFTFSDSNPSAWPMTTQKHRDWKTRHGFPATVGVMTEALKEAFSETPEIMTTKKKLEYTFDKSRSGYKGKPVIEYAWRFNEKRPILKYTMTWLRKRVLDVAVKTWLALNKTVEK
jgi:hypothetical protein